MSNSSNLSSGQRIPLVFGLVLTVVVFVVAFFALSQWPSCSGIGPCQTNWDILRYKSLPNEIGDMLAGFAGTLAFIWIVVTVWLQSQELADQRKVLVEQKNEFTTQNENMREQIFDNTFFQMLSTLREIIEAIDLNSLKFGQTTGRDCFKVYYERLDSSFKNSRNEDFEDVNDEFFEENGHQFGHYFRFLYNFFRFMDESEHTKKHHIKVLRSFLSDYELLLIYYNCLTQTGENFQKYLTKYEVFDNIPGSKFLNINDFSRYPEKAFGENSGYRTWKVYKT